MSLGEHMAPHEPYRMTHARLNRASLRLDAAVVIHLSEEDYSSDGSPISAITSCSPTISFDNHLPPIQKLGSVKNEDEREQTSGPIRSRSGSSTKPDKEKRKRSRVTQEQLAHLEGYFQADRSPTATRRREISELLGMQERQTQIWFQNRRAKAKLQDGKHLGVTEVVEPSPHTPPELSAGFEGELYSLIHEDGPVTIIPCTDLSIGSWRRIATPMDRHDLLAYVCDDKRCLTWYIKSGGYGFKMEIPFNTIIDTDFQNTAPGSGMASFILSQPPFFYLEHVSSSFPAERLWKRCADWTEGRQATHVLRHAIIGSSAQLVHLLRNLDTQAVGSDVTLQHPSAYQGQAQPSSPVALPLPQLASHSPSSPLTTERFQKCLEYSSPTPESPYTGNGTCQPLPLYNEYHHQGYTRYSDVHILQGRLALYSVQPIPLPYYSDGPPLQQYDQNFEHNA